MNFSEKDKKLVMLTGLYYPIVFLAIWFMWKNVYWLTLVLFILAFIELFNIGSKKVTVMFVLSSILGPAFESIAIYFGAWHYNTDSFLNIPLWLIPAWGNVAIFVLTFYKLLEKFGWLERKSGSN